MPITRNPFLESLGFPPPEEDPEEEKAAFLRKILEALRGGQPPEAVRPSAPNEYTGGGFDLGSVSDTERPEDPFAGLPGRDTVMRDPGEFPNPIESILKPLTPLDYAERLRKFAAEQGGARTAKDIIQGVTSVDLTAPLNQRQLGEGFFNVAALGIPFPGSKLQGYMAEPLGALIGKTTEVALPQIAKAVGGVSDALPGKLATIADSLGRAEVGVGKEVFGVGDNVPVRMTAKGKTPTPPEDFDPRALAAALDPEKPNIAAGNAAIKKLKAAGYDTTDVESYFDDFTQIRREDALTREDFIDERNSAWGDFIENIELAEKGLVDDIAPTTQPRPISFDINKASPIAIYEKLYEAVDKPLSVEDLTKALSALATKGVDIEDALAGLPRWQAATSAPTRSAAFTDLLETLVDADGNLKTVVTKTPAVPQGDELASIREQLKGPVQAIDRARLLRRVEELSRGAAPSTPPPTTTVPTAPIPPQPEILNVPKPPRTLEELQAAFDQARPGDLRYIGANLTDEEKAILAAEKARRIAETRATELPSVVEDLPIVDVPPIITPPRSLLDLQGIFEKAKTPRQIKERIASLTPEERELLTANGITLPTSGSGGKKPPIKPPTTTAAPSTAPDPNLPGGASKTLDAAKAADEAAGVTPEITTEIDNAAAKLTGRKPRVRRSAGDTPSATTTPPPPTQASIKPAVANLVSWIKASAPLRGENITKISAERARRAGMGAGELSPTGGAEQFNRSRAKLAGNILDDTTFTHPSGKTFPTEDLDTLSNFIATQPLPFYSKQRAGDALKKLSVGIPPQQNEIALLEEIFGADVGRSLTRRDWKWWALNLWNAPTALISSMDLSNPGRQGIFLSMGHPKTFAKSWAPQLKAFFSEENSRIAYEGITNSPSGKIGRSVGLDIINPMSTQGAARQEEFISNIFDDPEVWGGVVYNTIGQAVRPSNRAFVAFGNNQRHDIFASTIKNWFGEENLDAVAQAVLDAGDGPGAVRALDKALADFAPKGVTVKGKDVKLLAEFLNDATGRANPANMAKYGPVLNALFFSPRFAISRVMIPAKWIALGAMNPKSGMAKELRYLIMKDTLAFTATGLGILAVLNQTKWADVDMDPRSSDFGKIRIGPHRFDFWGGFQQWIRYPAQFLTGQRKTLGASEIHDAERGEVALRFFRSKLKPSVGTSIDVITGQDLTGEDVRVVGEQKDSALDTVKDLFLKNTVPLWVQDMFEGYDAELDADDKAGPGALVGIGTPAFLGMGVTSFDTPENRIPELRIFGRREELIARKFADQFGQSPETFQLLVNYYQVRPGSVLGVTQKGREKAGDIRTKLDNPELLKDFEKAAELFEDQMAAKYPKVLKQLQEDGQKLEFDPKTITDKPTPQYTANPKHKDGSITQAYAQQVLTNIFFSQLDWEVEVPEGKTTPPYNWLTPEYKATIDQWLEKANAKTYDIYGGSKKDKWWELGNTARTHVAKLVGDPEPPKGIRAHQIVKELMAEVEAGHGRAP